MKKSKGSIIYGRHPVVEAIKNGDQVEKVLIQNTVSGTFRSELMQLCKSNGIPVQFIPKVKISKIVTNNHQGVVAFLSLVKYYDLEDMISFTYEQGKNPLFLILDQISDVRNFGAICRSAELLGVNAVIIPKKGSAQINPDALKVSAGALSTLPVCRVDVLTDAVDILKSNGIEVFATDLEFSKEIHQVDFTGGVALILGAEGKGVSKKLLNKSDYRVSIPQIGNLDSYNVSVANAILLYEVQRQRNFLKNQ